jgi:hypothetical protein
MKINILLRLLTVCQNLAVLFLNTEGERQQREKAVGCGIPSDPFASIDGAASRFDRCVPHAKEQYYSIPCLSAQIF